MDSKTLFASKYFLENEKKLREETDSTTMELYSLRILQLENEELKTKLGRSLDRSLLLARVLTSCVVPI